MKSYKIKQLDESIIDCYPLYIECYNPVRDKDYEMVMIPAYDKGDIPVIVFARFTYRKNYNYRECKNMPFININKGDVKRLQSIYEVCKKIRK